MLRSSRALDCNLSCKQLFVFRTLLTSPTLCLWMVHIFTDLTEKTSPTWIAKAIERFLAVSVLTAGHHLAFGTVLARPSDSTSVTQCQIDMMEKKVECCSSNRSTRLANCTLFYYITSSPTHLLPYILLPYQMRSSERRKHAIASPGINDVRTTVTLQPTLNDDTEWEVREMHSSKLGWPRK